MRPWRTIEHENWIQREAGQPVGSCLWSSADKESTIRTCAGLPANTAGYLLAVAVGRIRNTDRPTKLSCPLTTAASPLEARFSSGSPLASDEERACIPEAPRSACWYKRLKCRPAPDKSQSSPETHPQVQS
jgi:hypothetical protein